MQILGYKKGHSIKHNADFTLVYTRETPKESDIQHGFIGEQSATLFIWGKQIDFDLKKTYEVIWGNSNGKAIPKDVKQID